MQLDGKRAIVVGGARGIGAATVKSLAREGAAVALLDIADEVATSTVKAAAGCGPGPVTYHHCDVSRRADAAAAFERVIRELGGLDVLFHVAGIEQQKPAEEITEEDLQLQLDVNLKGTVFTNQAAFYAMKRFGGAIINFGSYAGVLGFPSAAGYSAAKGGVLAWTRCVAQEWGRHMIRVNAICPAMITPMAEEAFAQMTPEQKQAFDARLARTIPLGGKMGNPDADWGGVAVFLASDASRFITGQTLCVDGGLLMLS